MLGRYSLLDLLLCSNGKSAKHGDLLCGIETALGESIQGPLQAAGCKLVVAVLSGVLLRRLQNGNLQRPNVRLNPSTASEVTVEVSTKCAQPSPCL